MLKLTLRSFVATHKAGSIVGAAAMVNRSPAAVSSQLKNLEDELGTGLFMRSGRSISLTREGQRILPLIEQVLLLLDQMNSQDSQSPFFSLGAIRSALSGILPILMNHIAHKRELGELKILSAMSSDLVRMVKTNDLDAAIVARPENENILDDLKVDTLFFEPYVLIVPVETKGSNLSCLIRSNTYIGFDRETWTGSQINRYLLKIGINVNPEIELNSMSAIASLVHRKYGVSIVPKNYGSNWINYFDIRCITLPNFSREVVIIRKDDNSAKSKMMYEIIDFLKTSA